MPTKYPLIYWILLVTGCMSSGIGIGGLLKARHYSNRTEHLQAVYGTAVTLHDDFTILLKDQPLDNYIQESRLFVKEGNTYLPVNRDDLEIGYSWYNSVIDTLWWAATHSTIACLCFILLGLMNHRSSKKHLALKQKNT